MLIHATRHHYDPAAVRPRQPVLRTLPSYRHLILILFRLASTAAFDGKTEFARSSTGAVETRGIVVVVVVVLVVDVVVSCWSGGIDPRRTIVCGCTTKYAKRTCTHTDTCIHTDRVPGRDIVYLKCGRRSRLLPIHLAQDGRQIELPPETQDQRALAAFPFLPSFLPAPRSATSLPYLSQSLTPSPFCTFLHPSSTRRGYWLLSLLGWPV